MSEHYEFDENDHGTRVLDEEEVPFTPEETRLLELGYRKKQYGPEARAVRKIIDAFPWILEVVAHKYDPVIAGYYVQAKGQIATIEAGLEHAIDKHLEKKYGQPTGQQPTNESGSAGKTDGRGEVQP